MLITINKTLPTEKEMLHLGAQLASVLADGGLLFCYGKLGAGKTTLARGILRGMGYQGKVKSPTYTIVEPYEQSGKMIYHFDLYRIKEPDELIQIGIADYLAPTSICVIEWPEQGFSLLPEPDIACYIEMAGEGRAVRLESHTVRGENMLDRLGKVSTSF